MHIIKYYILRVMRLKMFNKDMKPNIGTHKTQLFTLINKKESKYLAHELSRYLKHCLHQSI